MDRRAAVRVVGSALVVTLAMPDMVDAAVTWPLNQRVIGQTIDCEGKYFRVRPGEYYDGCTFLACAGIVVSDGAPDVYFCHNHIHFRARFFVDHPFITTEREVNEAWARQDEVVVRGNGQVQDQALNRVVRIYGAPFGTEPGPEYVN